MLFKLKLQLFFNVIYIFTYTNKIVHLVDWKIKKSNVLYMSSH